MKETISIAGADVGVVSYLYEAGRGCDGHPFVAEYYAISVTFPAGHRFEHRSKFLGTSAPVYDEDGWGPSFPDLREEAKAKAERLAERVRQAGVIRREHWNEARPVYGSEAYSSEDDLMVERREAEEGQ